MAAMHAQALYNPQTLPRRTVAIGHAFRAEAGARGKDTRGLYRVHQFTKVELFSVVAGDAKKRTDGEMDQANETEKASDRELEYICGLQIELYKGLGIPFRYVSLHSLIPAVNIDRALEECSICRLKNLAPPRTENMILKPGCQVEAPGVKSHQLPIAQTTKLVVYTFVIGTRTTTHQQQARFRTPTRSTAQLSQFLG
jgi:hypothetical protein